MDDDKRITIKRWFIKSEHDIKMAYAALLMADPLTDMACFHAQQCAEKSLKAFLVFHDRQVEKTHDLGKLVDACGKLDGSFLEMQPDLRGMSAYALEAPFLIPKTSHANDNGSVVNFTKVPPPAT